VWYTDKDSSRLSGDELRWGGDVKSQTPAGRVERVTSNCVDIDDI
jgi:hypothetical protein